MVSECPSAEGHPETVRNASRVMECGSEAAAVEFDQTAVAGATALRWGVTGSAIS